MASVVAFDSQIGFVYSSINGETGEVVKACDKSKLPKRIAFAIKLEEDGNPKLYPSDKGEIKVCLQSEDKSMFTFMLQSTYEEKLKLKDIGGIQAIVSSKDEEGNPIGPRIWFGVEPVVSPKMSDL